MYYLRVYFKTFDFRHIDHIVFQLEHYELTSIATTMNNLGWFFESFWSHNAHQQNASSIFVCLLGIFNMRRPMMRSFSPIPLYFIAHMCNLMVQYALLFIRCCAHYGNCFTCAPFVARLNRCNWFSCFFPTIASNAHFYSGIHSQISFHQFSLDPFVALSFHSFSHFYCFHIILKAVHGWKFQNQIKIRVSMAISNHQFYSIEFQPSFHFLFPFISYFE